MLTLRTAGIVCAVRGHGENAAIVRLLTPESGLVAGYVRGGRSTRLRPILQPGNGVTAELRARVDTALPALTADLDRSRAALHASPLTASALEWVTALTAVALPEGQPYAGLYGALDAMLDALALAPSARGWASALARYELLMLDSLGFALDLDVCVVSGATDDLAFVSPVSGGAVTAVAAGQYAGRLLPLPAHLRGSGAAPTMADALAALTLSGHFVAERLLPGRAARTMAARHRLMDRLQRAVA